MLKLQVGLEDQDLLIDALTSEGFKVLVSKIVPQLIEHKRTGLLSHKLTDHKSFTQLALMRAELDGMNAILKELRELKQMLKSGASVNRK